MTSSQKKHIFTFVLLGIGCLTAVLYWNLMLQKQNHLLISGASFANNQKQDWVQIYNPSLNHQSIKYFYLSDDTGDPTRYQIPFDLVVPSHGTVTLYGKKARDIPPGTARLTFSFSSGETLVLSTPDGKLVDKLPLVMPPDFKGPFSLGRNPRDSSRTEIHYPSPYQKVHEGRE